MTHALYPLPGLAKGNEANASKLGVLGVAETLCAVLKTHPFSTHVSQPVNAWQSSYSRY